jgi:Ca2+-binding RTX toxin-like protein
MTIYDDLSTGQSEALKANVLRGVDSLAGSSSSDGLLGMAGNDTLPLENAVFNKLATTGTSSAANFRSAVGAHALARNDHVIYDSGTGTGTGKLYYDADGSGADAAVQIAVLTGLPPITNTDIFVI